MEMNLNPLSSVPSNTSLGTQTIATIVTTVAYYNNHLFLQTAACQTIAGAFTWAAILITGYHVKLSMLK